MLLLSGGTRRQPVPLRVSTPTTHEPLILSLKQTRVRFQAGPALPVKLGFSTNADKRKSPLLMSEVESNHCRLPPPARLQLRPSLGVNVQR